VDIDVLGAGVIGLVAAWRLTEAGHRVRVVAAEPPERTTSAVAAAFWYPFRAAPRDRITRWSAETYQELAALTAVPGAGVRMRWGRELYREPTADPWWSSAVPGWERLGPQALPTGYSDGLGLTVPVVEMPRHLRWLSELLAGHGVSVVRQRVRRLDELHSPVIVNCTGLGARALVPDPSLTALRGQVVVVEQTGVTEWLLDQSDEKNVTYVVPREETIVLGGTTEEDVEDLAPDPATAADILDRCAALVPEVAGARVLAHRVGLRPARPAVRLDAQPRADGGTLVHCYGHGGAGVTLAYGCAREIVQLVDDPR
jgi:D-amino-acid oxidase